KGRGAGGRPAIEIVITVTDGRRSRGVIRKIPKRHGRRPGLSRGGIGHRPNGVWIRRRRQLARPVQRGWLIAPALAGGAGWAVERGDRLVFGAASGLTSVLLARHACGMSRRRRLALRRVGLGLAELYPWRIGLCRARGRSLNLRRRGLEWGGGKRRRKSGA